MENIMIDDIINKIQLFMIIIMIKFFLFARYEYIYFISISDKRVPYISLDEIKREGKERRK